jgi:hypothetical protein
LDKHDPPNLMHGILNVEQRVKPAQNEQIEMMQVEERIAPGKGIIAQSLPDRLQGICIFLPDAGSECLLSPFPELLAQPL